MTSLNKRRVQSDNPRVFEKEAEGLVRKIEIEHDASTEPFDLTGEIINVLNIRIWRMLSRSGYTLRYGNLVGQNLELHFIEKGRYIFRSGGIEIDARANSAVLLKDTSKVELIACPGSSKLAVMIPLTRFSLLVGPEHGAAVRKLLTFHSHVQQGEDGVDLIEKIARLLVGDEPQENPFAKAPNGALLLGDALIATFAGSWPKTDSPVVEAQTLPRHLQRAIDWLDTNAGEDISIEQLAHQCGASIRTLQNSFKRYLSTTPNAYIQRVRLSRIHNELLSGDGTLTIEQIAERWGFSHMGYFAARYRTAYGETPSSTRLKRKFAES